MPAVRCIVYATLITTFLSLAFLKVLASDHSVVKPLRVSFIMAGPVADYGWNQSHNEGRLYLDKTMSSKVITSFAEQIPTNAEAERVMEKWIAQGTKLIFLTSYGYLDPALKVAERHKDVIFMQILRKSDKKAENVGEYFPYYYEPLYAAGIVAGRMTRSAKIGCVAGHLVPCVLAAVNSFALGIQSVNPKVKVKLVCTNSWYDPVTEAEATKALADGGADVVVSILDSSLTVCRTAQKAGIYCVGLNCDLNSQVPKAWLTGQVHNFGPLYASIVQQVIDGRWKARTTYYTMKDGYSGLGSLGSAVPPAVKREALAAAQKLKDGKLTVFQGPLKDASGRVRIPSGKVADPEMLSSMNWVVPGIDGYSSK